MTECPVLTQDNCGKAEWSLPTSVDLFPLLRGNWRAIVVVLVPTIGVQESHRVREVCSLGKKRARKKVVHIHVKSVEIEFYD